MAHSSIGPSSAERWMACPGSVALSATCPAQKTSPAAAEGTVAHSIAEKLVRGQADELELMTKIGDIVPQGGHDVEISEEMLDGARLYRDTIQADYVALTKMGRPAAIERHCEVRVGAPAIDKHLWGTTDYLMFQKGNKLIVYDYKFGKGKTVAVEANPQAALYALAAMETMAGEAFDEVELVIVQPRGSGNPVKRWSTTPQWLRDNFKVEVVEALRLARGENPPLKAGDHCRWCPAQAVCPAIAAQVQETAQADFTTLAPTEAEIEAKDLRGLPQVAGLTPVQLAQALDWEDAISAWFGAIRERAQGILTGGGDVPGYKLVDGRSNRKWADETGEKAAAHFAPKYGHRVYAPKKPLSVAQMEKLVGKGKLPEELVVKPEAPKKIAPSDDPRPVASTTAQQDFDPLALPAPETVKAGEFDTFSLSAVKGENADPLALDPLEPAGVKARPAADALLDEIQGKKKEPLWP